jgi:hypothetical protein
MIPKGSIQGSEGGCPNLARNFPPDPAFAIGVDEL